MRERQDGLDSNVQNGDREHDLGDLKNAVDMFRNSAHAVAERPELFWKRQRAVISERLHDEVPAIRPRLTIAWSTAALAMLLCLFFFMQPIKAPTPDLPAGADQTLLIEVEKALSREYPEALMPAALTTQEPERPHGMQ
jgi:hypothetical protein